MRYSEVINEAEKSLKGYESLLDEFAMLVTFNIASVGKQGKDPESNTKLGSMTKRFNQAAINGKTFSEIHADRQFYRNPKVIPHVLKFIYDSLVFIRSHFEHCLADKFKQPMLARLSNVEKLYSEQVVYLS